MIHVYVKFSQNTNSSVCVCVCVCICVCASVLLIYDMKPLTKTHSLIFPLGMPLQQDSVETAHGG